MSGDVWLGLALPGVVVTWFVTCFPALPSQGRPGMALYITDDTMTLKIDDRVVATAWFS